MSDENTLEERRKLLIPATFGVHSKITNDLRDYISRTFGHSTFSFHEAYLDKPVQWQQDFKKAVEDPTNGTTEPFLSRFVHQSGLAPKVDDTLLQEFKTKIKNKEDFDPLIIPLVATSKYSYHEGLEKLAFSLDNSIILRGVLQIWLTVEKGGRAQSQPYPAVCAIGSDHWECIKEWNNKIFVGCPNLIKYPPDLSDSVVVIGRLCRHEIQEWYRTAVRDHLVANDPNSDKKALALLREYQIALRPWIEAEHMPVWVGVSISSDALFWGECVVLLPGPEDDKLTEVLVKQYEGVADILSDNVRRTFMPIMTIFETYSLEHRLKKAWDNTKKDWDKASVWHRKRTLLGSLPSFMNLHEHWNIWARKTRKNLRALFDIGIGKEPGTALGPKGGIDVELLDKMADGDHGHLFMSLLRNCLIIESSSTNKIVNQNKTDQNWRTKLNDLERSLVSLWAARYSLIFEHLPTYYSQVNQFIGKMKVIEESLVFENYLMSSPAILNAMISAMQIRHGDRGTGKPSVKTALVIGGPGSGKDSMAKLVRLFSPGYRFGSLATLNMASFRPKEAAVPLLLGLDVHYNFGPNSRSKLSFSSMLARMWQKTRSSEGTEPFSNGRGLTFIFDELNSLDIDTQGALLRFLESGELSALGDIDGKSDRVDALVIGVMNEDPESITKVRTLDRVLRDKHVFGGMLGDFLYEMFRGQRRLRDDLYFRMARGGKIVLPILRHRREDIPILFHFFVDKELMPSIRNDEKRPELETELSVYEELMDTGLEWQGNVRELQALAKVIFTLAYDAYKEQQKIRNTGEEPPLTLRGAHVRIAQQILARTGQENSEVLVHLA
jgi:hypothetical protein